METYAESYYKSKNTKGIIALKVVIIVVTIVLVLLVILSGVTYLALVGGLLVVVEYYGFSRMGTQYEVVYCDGQFDFDKINGTMGRKTMFQIDMEQVELIAPFGHEELGSYQNVPVKKKLIPGSEKDSYVIVVKDEKSGELIKILFYPTEKMLDCIYYKSPRKLKRRPEQIE